MSDITAETVSRARLDSLVDEIGDQDIVRQAVQSFLDELVDNAVRHARATSVRLNVSLEDNAVVFDVVDDGIGCTWETPTRPTGGSGLAQTARLAAALGGTVEVRRLPEGGTSARLRVHAPVHVPTVQSDHSTRVLLVDDNDVNRRLAAAMLGKLGVTTLSLIHI